MKRVLGVAVLGGVLLLAFVWTMRRNAGEERATPDPAAAAMASPGMAAASASAFGARPQSMAAVPAPLPTAPPAPMPAPATTGTATRDAAACARLAELCSTSDRPVDASACEKDLVDARKMSGANNVDRSASCVLESQTCAAATGCVSGGVGLGAFGEFLKGLGSALSK